MDDNISVHSRTSSRPSELTTSEEGRAQRYRSALLARTSFTTRLSFPGQPAIFRHLEAGQPTFLLSFKPAGFKGLLEKLYPGCSVVWESGLHPHPHPQAHGERALAELWIGQHMAEVAWPRTVYDVGSNAGRTLHALQQSVSVNMHSSVPVIMAGDAERAAQARRMLRTRAGLGSVCGCRFESCQHCLEGPLTTLLVHSVYYTDPITLAARSRQGPVVAIHHQFDEIAGTLCTGDLAYALQEDGQLLCQARGNSLRYDHPPCLDLFGLGVCVGPDLWLVPERLVTFNDTHVTRFEVVARVSRGPPPWQVGLDLVAVREGLKTEDARGLTTELPGLSALFVEDATISFDGAVPRVVVRGRSVLATHPAAIQLARQLSMMMPRTPEGLLTILARMRSEQLKGASLVANPTALAFATVIGFFADAGREAALLGRANAQHGPVRAAHALALAGAPIPRERWYHRFYPTNVAKRWSRAFWGACDCATDEDEARVGHLAPAAGLQPLLNAGLNPRTVTPVAGPLVVPCLIPLAEDVPPQRKGAVIRDVGQPLRRDRPSRQLTLELVALGDPPGIHPDTREGLRRAIEVRLARDELEPDPHLLGPLVVGAVPPDNPVAIIRGLAPLVIDPGMWAAWLAHLPAKIRPDVELANHRLRTAGSSPSDFRHHIFIKREKAGRMADGGFADGVPRNVVSGTPASIAARGPSDWYRSHALRAAFDGSGDVLWALGRPADVCANFLMDAVEEFGGWENCVVVCADLSKCEAHRNPMLQKYLDKNLDCLQLDALYWEFARRRHQLAAASRDHGLVVRVPNAQVSGETNTSTETFEVSVTVEGTLHRLRIRFRALKLGDDTVIVTSCARAVTPEMYVDIAARLGITVKAHQAHRIGDVTFCQKFLLPCMGGGYTFVPLLGRTLHRAPWNCNDSRWDCAAVLRGLLPSISGCPFLADYAGLVLGRAGPGRAMPLEEWAMAAPADWSMHPSGWGVLFDRYGLTPVDLDHFRVHVERALAVGFPVYSHWPRLASLCEVDE